MPLPCVLCVVLGLPSRDDYFSNCTDYQVENYFMDSDTQMSLQKENYQFIPIENK